MNTVVSVASLVSATAVAAPSLSPSTVPETSFPDLHARLSKVRNWWWDRQKRDAENRQVYEAAYAEAAKRGVTRKDFDPSPELSTNDPVDEHGCSIEWSNIFDEINSTFDLISSCTPKNAADLGLFAQAFALRNSQYWIGDEDDDKIVMLVEALARFAGVEVLPGGELSLFDVYHHHRDNSQDDIPEPNAKRVEKDPIFSLIRAHENAHKRFDDKLAELEVLDKAKFAGAETLEHKRARKALDRRIDRAARREMKAWHAVLAAIPESDVGRVSMLGYIRTECRGRTLDVDEVATVLKSAHEMVAPSYMRCMPLYGTSPQDAA